MQNNIGNNVINNTISSWEENSTEQKVKRKTLVGPWKNKAEFSEVYNLIYGKNAGDKTYLQALRHLRYWTLRRSILCPAAVLATKVLLEVRRKEKACHDTETMQSLYAGAFTRFFNFMSSIMQTHNLRTMYETAQQLGLKPFVVDIRHMCAHGQELPPLEVLRNAANYCLQWLQDFYWNDHLANMCDIDCKAIRRKDQTQLDEYVSIYCVLYDAALECFMRGGLNLKAAKSILSGKRLAVIKEYCKQHKCKDIKTIMDNVVVKLSNLIQSQASIKDLTDIFIESISKMKFFYTFEENKLNDEQFENLIAVTQKFFRFLAECGLIEDFFYNLIDIAENENSDVDLRAGASFWAKQIVSGFRLFQICKRRNKQEMDKSKKGNELDFTELNEGKISKKMRHLLVYSGIDHKRTLIFGDSIRRPWIWTFDTKFLEKRMENVNEYTAPILKNLLPLIEFPDNQHKAIKAFEELLDNLFTAHDAEDPSSASLSVNAAVYTVNSIFKDARDTPALQNFNEEIQIGIWSRAPADETINWAQCPLGRLPWE